MKKFLTGVLASLCVGAAVSVVATDSITAKADYLVFYLESLGHPPASVLALEEAKVKNMTSWDYCKVDELYDAWYFSGDGTAEKNPEIRFVVDGVQTVTKPYTLVPMEVSAFSFEYCIVNDSRATVEDLRQDKYIVQILASDGTYPIIRTNIEADGDWHEIRVDKNTPLYANESPTYAGFQKKFCGFLFKMGGLDGEFLIRYITVYDADGNEIYPEEIEYDDDVTSEESEVTSEMESEIVGESESAVESEIVSAEESASSQAPASSSASETASKSGCGSFGVGAMALSSLTAAGVVLGLSKKKRK